MCNNSQGYYGYRSQQLPPVLEFGQSLNKYLEDFKELSTRDPEAAKEQATQQLLRSGLVEYVDGKLKTKQLIK